MKKNLSLYIFVIILVAVLVVAISIVVRSYNKAKSITPDVNYLRTLTIEDMEKIKMQYSTEDKKQEFLDICSKIELTVANMFLDGSVTNKEELKTKVNNINQILASKNWDDLGMEFPNYWMGTWNLDDNGKLTFTFNNEGIKPEWTKDIDVSKYIK